MTFVKGGAAAVALCFALAAAPSRAEGVRDTLSRIETSQAAIKVDVSSIKSTVGEMKEKQAQYDNNIGVFYKNHHLPLRAEWATVVHVPEFRASLTRIDRLERNDDLILGAFIVVGFFWTLLCALAAWLFQGLRVSVQQLATPRGQTGGDG